MEPSVLVNKFYAAFAQRDGESMVACYHPDVQFSDPVFPDLRGRDAGDMWRMLTATGKDLQVVADVDPSGKKAHWTATYTFSATGRKVVNEIDATFEFADDKIIRHIDRFDLWKWSRQALGPSGWLLGWSPIVRNRIQGQAAGLLKKYQAKSQDLAEDDPTELSERPAGTGGDGTG